MKPRGLAAFRSLAIPLALALAAGASAPAEAAPILGSGAGCTFPSGVGGSFPSCDTTLSNQVCKWSSGGRCGTAYVPAGMASKNVRTVFFFHPGGGDAALIAQNDRYLWNAKAREAKILVFYPQAPGSVTPDLCDLPTWNGKHCCGEAFRENRGDAAYVEGLVNAVKAIPSPADPTKKLVAGTRVFATGFSNGGILVHRLAADKPGLFARVAAAAGTVGGNGGNDLNANGNDVCPNPGAPGGFGGDCAGGPAVKEIGPTAAKAVMMVHGMLDDHVEVDGGRSLGGDPQRCDLSQARSWNRWVGRNQATQYLDGYPDGGYFVDAASGNAAVVHLYAPYTDHHWPGEDEDPGKAHYAYTATDAIWDGFFADFTIFP